MAAAVAALFVGLCPFLAALAMEIAVGAGTGIPAIRHLACCRHCGRAHRLGVVEVPRAPGQQEHLLMRRRGAVRRAFRCGIPLGPHDLGPQPPPVRLERHRHAGRHHHQVLRLQSRGFPTFWNRTISRSAPSRLLDFRPNVVVGEVSASRIAISARSCDIRIPVVDPVCAVLPQHAADLAEHGHHRVEMFVHRRLKADRAIDAVVPQAPIGRRGHHAVHALVRQLAQPLHAVAGEDADGHAAPRKI